MAQTRHKKQNSHSQKQVIKVTPQGSFLLLLKKHKSKLKGINWEFPIQSFFLCFNSKVEDFSLILTNYSSRTSEFEPIVH